MFVSILLYWSKHHLPHISYPWLRWSVHRCFLCTCVATKTKTSSSWPQGRVLLLLPHLSSLTLSAHKLSPDSIGELHLLTNLTSLDLRGVLEVDNSYTVSTLSTLTQLQHLALGNPDKAQCVSSSEKDVKKLVNLTALIEVSTS